MPTIIDKLRRQFGKKSDVPVVQPEAPKPSEADQRYLALAAMLGFGAEELKDPKIQETLSELFSLSSAPGISTFVDFWDAAGFIHSSEFGVSESSRTSRYKQYEFMLANCSEAGQAVTMYVDECVSAVREEAKFFSFDVLVNGKRDDRLSRFVDAAISSAGVMSDLRSRFGHLVLKGDAFYRIKSIAEASGSSRNTDGWALTGYWTEVPDVVTRWNLPHRDVPFKFSESLRIGGRTIPVAPWDMVHFRMGTFRTDILPYGEPVLEAVRASYRRLLILEALLAMTRSSRVERLLISVPTGTDNPDLMVTKLVRFKALMKNIIMGTGSAATAEKRSMAFTDAYYIPKGKDAQSSVEIDKLQTSLDLSSIEDVEYFLTKFIYGLGVPQGFLKTDDAYAGYRKLALQDLRVSRRVNSILRSFAEGMTLLGKIFLFRSGRWQSEGMELVTSYLPPAPVAVEQLESIRTTVEIIGSILEAIGSKETASPMASHRIVRALLLRFAQIPSRILDEILPLEGTKGIHTEEISLALETAFLDGMRESVSSRDTSFIDCTDLSDPGSPSLATEATLLSLADRIV